MAAEDWLESDILKNGYNLFGRGMATIMVDEE